jgi:hypothetical protein
MSSHWAELAEQAICHITCQTNPLRLQLGFSIDLADPGRQATAQFPVWAKNTEADQK